MYQVPAQLSYSPNNNYVALPIEDMHHVLYVYRAGIKQAKRDNPEHAEALDAQLAWCDQQLMELSAMIELEANNDPN